tara:strand:+ start:131 stop:601 length:471 start_codon:yes stop_codon:yes gene_type:complete
MKVDLSKEEYRVLVEVFSLAGMVLDAYGRGNVPEKKPFYELEQKIYASCDDFGSGDMIRRDPHSNELARKWNEKTPERVVRIYDQFVDDAFWEELILRMVDRDLQAEMTLSGVGEEALTEEKWQKRKNELELHYENAFRQFGLGGIRLTHDDEGSN